EDTARFLSDAAASGYFDAERVAFFGVVADPGDAELPCAADALPGVRYFLDFDHTISRLYGAIGADGQPRRVIYVLDPALRVLAVNRGRGDLLAGLTRILDKLRLPEPVLARPQAPVLVLPRIFEPGLCKTLIDFYERAGGSESGFMRDKQG